jgi:hypothetical protein
MLLWLSAPWSVTIASGQGQKTDVKVLERGDCDLQYPSMEERERARNEIHQNVASVISSTICNGTPGWRRVAFINMTDTSYDCPAGLNLTSYSKRTCGASHTAQSGCSSTIFSVGGLPYSRVCGRIRAYQFGATGAFGDYVRDIDNHYVDGVSLTHGETGSRQHIWTFASGGSEVTTIYLNHACPCDTAPPSVVPAFVGNDYFCESGVHSEWNHNFTLYPDDVLWDGQNCTSNSTCCQFNNPPWFTKNRPNATTDDIELRICTNAPTWLGDVPIELVELYVQ